VTNVVDANLLACHASAEQVAGEVFNIGCGAATSIRDLWRRIADIVGVDLEPQHDAPRAGDVRHSLASIAKAREHFGYTPKMTLDEGLSRTIDHFRKRLRTPAPARLRIAV